MRNPDASTGGAEALGQDLNQMYLVGTGVTREHGFSLEKTPVHVKHETAISHAGLDYCLA